MFFTKFQPEVCSSFALFQPQRYKKECTYGKLLPNTTSLQRPGFFVPTVRLGSISAGALSSPVFQLVIDPTLRQSIHFTLIETSLQRRRGI